MTAVEWLIEKLNINGVVIPMEIESKAKAMEKEQMESHKYTQGIENLQKVIEELKQQEQ